MSVACCMLAFSVGCSGHKSEPEVKPETGTQVVVRPQNTSRPNRPATRPSAGSTGEKPLPMRREEPFVPKAPGLRVSRVNVPGMYVALTFDDGPSPSLTPRVLDILNEYGAKGTFFVVGRNAALNGHILARAVAEGHEIGSHTWSHIKMTGSSREKILSEMERTGNAILSATGRTPKVMRPPYGAVNAGIVGLMHDRYGMSTILWDVDTRDWQHPGVNAVIQRAVGGARPGSIILLHDIHSSTLAAVEGVVAGLQARGFRLVTVSQLLALSRRAATAAQQPEQTDASTTVQPQPAEVPAPVSTVPEPAPEASAALAVPAPENVPSAEPAAPAEQPAAPAGSAEQPSAGGASISGVTEG